MSDILSPQGFEPADALQDTDVQEVYQGGSLGIRRNKQAALLAYKTYYQKLTTFTGNNIMESDGSGNPRTTGIATSSVSATIAQSDANAVELTDKINQGVKTTDSPIFADATIGGHAVGAELSTLNNRVDQDVRIAATPTFFDLVLNGVASVKDSIIDLLSRMGLTESATSTNTSDIDDLETKTPQSYKTTDTITLVDLVLTGVASVKNAIIALIDKTPQSYKTTDDVEFNKVSMDKVVTFRSASTTKGDLFSALILALDIVGEHCIVAGSITLSGNMAICSHAIRSSPTQVTLFNVRVGDSALGTTALDSGSGDVVTGVSISTGILTS